VQIEKELERVCTSFQNVHFLQKNTFPIDDDVLIAGCTLWTDVDSECETWMRDYESIYKCGENVDGKSELVKSSDLRQKHREMVTWIGDLLLKDDVEQRKVIMLTHHAPSAEMLEGSNKVSDLEKRMYCSNCDHLFKRPLISWFSGHTHVSLRKKINGINCVSNCWGYPGQKIGYDKSYFTKI
jgi:predicted phosphohydrolase